VGVEITDADVYDLYGSVDASFSSVVGGERLQVVV
jgi:hypothetical protein